jgi:hypothetical protein
MTRLVVLQHLQREGPGLFALEAARRGWPNSRGGAAGVGALGPGGVVCQGNRLIAYLPDQPTAEVVFR